MSSRAPSDSARRECFDEQGERLGRADRRARRRAMNDRRSGIFDLGGQLAARAGSAAASGSAAYQYISGRLWSSASSACASRPSRMSQRRRAAGAAGPRPGRGGRPARGRTPRAARISPGWRRRAARPPCELDGPGRDERACRSEAPGEVVLAGARRVQGPDGAQPMRLRASRRRVQADIARRSRVLQAIVPAPSAAASPALLEDPAGVADVPVVRVELSWTSSSSLELRQVDLRRLGRRRRP